VASAQYEPLWSPFTSDEERKFGFERQPLAAQVCATTLFSFLLTMALLGYTPVLPSPQPHQAFFARRRFPSQVNIMTLARALLPLLATGEEAGGGMALNEATAGRLQVPSSFRLGASSKRGCPARTSRFYRT